MAVVKGPLFSMAASGSIAGAITYSNWKGRAYVRQRVVPSNPKSGAQVGRRAMMKWLAQDWTNIGGPAQATWQAIADQIVCSTFNAYIKHNMERWHNFLSPITDYPAAEVGTGSDNALTAAAWEENRCKISIAGTVLDTAWGLMIFGKLGAVVTPSVGTALFVVVDDTFAARDVFWTPHEGAVSAQWTFDSRSFSNDGVFAAAGGPQST